MDDVAEHCESRRRTTAFSAAAAVPATKIDDVEASACRSCLKTSLNGQRLGKRRDHASRPLFWTVIETTSASFEQSPKKVFMYYFDKLIRNWDTISKHSHTFRTSIWPNDFVLAQYTLIEAAIFQYFFHLSDSHWHVLQHRNTLHERACDCLGTRTWYHQTRLRHAIKFHLSLATEI